MEFSRELFFARHPDPMWIYEVATLRFLEVNDAAVSRYGYSRAEFLAMTIADIRPPEDVPRLLDAVRAVTDAQQQPEIWRHRYCSGETVYVEILSQVLDYQGTIAELIVARNITRQIQVERERAELLELSDELYESNQRLREQDANLRTAQRLLGLGIWKMNLDTGALVWSDNVYAMYGVMREAFGHDFASYVALVHPDDRDEMQENFARFVDAGTYHFEFRHRVTKGDRGEFALLRGVGELAVTPLGRVLTGVVMDITAEEEGARRLSEATGLVNLAGRMARLGGWYVDLDTQVVTWTPETAAIHGMREATEVCVDNGIEFFAPEFRERITTLFKRCAERGEPYDEVLQIIAIDGRRVWARTIGEPERNADGVIVAVRGALQDVSELVFARQQSEDLAQRLQNTLDSISDGFLTLDRELRITYANRQAERLLQQTAAQMLGEPIWARFPGARGTLFESKFAGVLSGQETAHFTEFGKNLGKWLQVSAYPSKDGLTVYFRDITQDREDQQQLRLLESAVARLNDVLMITDASPIDAPDGPRIVYVNEAFERRTGYRADEVIGKTPRLLQGPKTQRAELDRIREAMERWEPVRAELINYTKCGDECWLELDIVPIADEGGKYTHWVAVERDITRRKSDEAALKVSEERFKLVAKATNDVVWDWDLATDQVWWNENLHTTLGYDLATIAGDSTSWSSNIHPDDRDRIVADIHAVIAGSGDIWRDEYRYLRADGSVAIVVDRGFVIRDASGRAVRMLGSMVDITVQRQQDENLRQSQKLEAVGQLTGGVAHDFNNLLTVILGNAELLAEQLSDNEPLRAMAEMTAGAASRGAELTNRLLAFARRQPLQPRPLDLNQLVAGLDGLLRRTLMEHIDLEVARSGGLGVVEVDPGQFEVALLNLAINARDAMPDGGCLTIETANVDLDENYAEQHHEVVAGRYVMVSVSDTGQGMSAELVRRAFEPFFTTKPSGRGSGLGLSMVYGFVKQSGARGNSTAWDGLSPDSGERRRRGGHGKAPGAQGAVHVGVYRKCHRAPRPPGFRRGVAEQALSASRPGSPGSEGPGSLAAALPPQLSGGT